MQEAWRTAIADSEVDIDLLRQLLQSAAGLQVFQNFDVSELRSACHSCSKVSCHPDWGTDTPYCWLRLHALYRFLFCWRVPLKGP